MIHKAGWAALQNTRFLSFITVMPIDDIIEHDKKLWGCACKPTKSYERGVDGTILGVIFTHTAYDGRI